MTEKIYHSYSLNVTRSVTPSLWICSFGLLGISAMAITSAVQSGLDSYTVIFGLAAIAYAAVFFFSVWWMFRCYFIYVFENGRLSIRLFNGKEIARYGKDDVDHLE